MGRNWAASENPPRRWKPTAKHLRDVARAADHEVYRRLEELRWPNVVNLAEGMILGEGIERFLRFHPTMKGV